MDTRSLKLDLAELEALRVPSDGAAATPPVHDLRYLIAALATAGGVAGDSGALPLEPSCPNAPGSCSNWEQRNKGETIPYKYH